MRMFTVLSTMLTVISSLYANQDRYDHPITALYIISSPKNYVGGGECNAYYQGQDGTLSIKDNQKGITVSFKTFDNSYSNNWDIEFHPPGQTTLEKGLYKKAERHLYNKSESPGLSVSGSGRSCSDPFGEFEILEIKRNRKGEIESFAANFVQRCEVKGAPLFGSIRYYSTIPVEARFSELLRKNVESFLYLKKYDEVTGTTTHPSFISGINSSTNLYPLPYGGDGFEVIVEGSYGRWVLDFAGPGGENLKPGFYETIERYPWNVSPNPGIEITTPRGHFGLVLGAFNLREYKKDKEGKISQLALDFSIEGESKEILEGSIRFNSDLPVDLKEPLKR